MKPTIFSRYLGVKLSASLTIAALWSTFPTQAQQSQQPTFLSGDGAAQTLFQAVQGNDEQAIATILGGPSELASSGDSQQDKFDRALFVEKYKQMHRLSHDSDGSLTLYLGAENWPFPIPLIVKDGRWSFNPEVGKMEVLYRRIGYNEIVAVVTCHEFVSAAKRYSPDTPEIDVAVSSPDSLVAKAVTGKASSQPVLLQGYYFRVIPQPQSTPGKFVLIGYPAEYRSSGVKTFVATDKGLVYEKDLGPDTPAVAAAMTAFRKDGTWRASE